MCKNGNSLRDTTKEKRKKTNLKRLLSEHKEDVAHFGNILYRLDSCMLSCFCAETFL